MLPNESQVLLVAKIHKQLYTACESVLSATQLVRITCGTPSAAENQFRQKVTVFDLLNVVDKIVG